LTGSFVQLHTNTVRVPLALKLGGVLLTNNCLGISGGPFVSFVAFVSFVVKLWHSPAEAPI
jgi:hypothetical protein